MKKIISLGICLLLLLSIIPIALMGSGWSNGPTTIDISVSSITDNTFEVYIDLGALATNTDRLGSFIFNIQYNSKLFELDNSKWVSSDDDALNGLIKIDIINTNNAIFDYNDLYKDENTNVIYISGARTGGLASDAIKVTVYFKLKDDACYGGSGDFKLLSGQEYRGSGLVELFELTSKNDDSSILNLDSLDGTHSVTLDVPITKVDIQGELTTPVKKATNTTSLYATNTQIQVEWSPAIEVGEKFAGDTEYTATVTVLPATDYTLSELATVTGLEGFDFAYSNGNFVASKTFDKTDGLWYPTIETVPTVGSIEYGQLASESNIGSNGVAKYNSETVSGTWSWATGSDVRCTDIASGCKATLLFTPDNEADYGCVSTETSITVNQKDISSGIEVYVTPKVKYNNGETVYPSVIIATYTDAGYVLASGTDYTVKYSNNTAVGTAAKVTLTGTGKYTGTKEVNFEIIPGTQSLTVPGAITKTYGEENFNIVATCTDATLSYASSDTKVIEINSSTGEAKIKGAGSSTITITATRDSYDTASNTVLVTVNPKSISGISISSITDVEYTGNAITPYFVASDTDLSKVLASGTDYTVSYTSNINVGTAKITLTGINNYTGTKEITFNITKANQNINLASNTVIKTYGDASVTDLVTNEASFTTLSYSSDNTSVVDNNLAIKGAGNATITITAPENDNHKKATATVLVTVNKAKLTITASDTTITYGDNAKNNGVTYSGFVNNETISNLTGSLSYIYSYDTTVAANRKPGTYKITPASVTSANYDIKFVDGTLKVEKKPLTIATATAFKAITKDYDGNTTATVTPNDSNLFKESLPFSDVIGLNLANATATYDNQYAGENKVVTLNATYSLLGSNTDCYELTSPGFDLKLTGKITSFKPTITLATTTHLKVAWNSYIDLAGSAKINREGITILYDINTHYDTNLTLVGTILTVPPTMSGYIGNPIQIDVYASATDLNGDGNPEYSAPDTYKFLYLDVVNKDNANVSVSGVPANKTKYLGDGNFTLTATAANKESTGATWKWTVSGSGVSIVSATNTDSCEFKVNSVTATPTKISVTYEDNKYKDTEEIELNVYKRPLAVTSVTVAEKVYDGTTKATITGLTYSGLLSADENNIKVNGITANFKTSAAGETVVNVDYSKATIVATGTSTASIYELSTKTSVATTTSLIKKAPQTINVAADSYTKNYGDDTFTVVASCTSANLTYSSSNDSVATVNNTSGLVTIKGAGDTTIKVTASATNYVTTSTDISLKVNKATLTVIAKEKTIKYGEDPANNGVTYSGFKYQDTSTTTNLLTGTLAYDYNYTKGNNVGSYTITPKGLSSNNYNITYTAGTLHVEKADQKINLASSTVVKTYGNGTITDLGISNKDTLSSLSYKSSAPTVVDDNLVIKGAGDATITITAASTTNVNLATATVLVKVNKAPLTIKASDTTITYGDLATNTGVTYAGFVNGDTSSSLGGTLKYSYTYDKNVSDKRVVGDYEIIVASETSSNYNITYEKGTLKVVPKALTVATSTAFNDISKSYDGNTTATVTAKSSTLFNESLVFNDTIGLNLTNVSANYADQYVGTDKVVTLNATYGLLGSNTNCYTLTSPGSDLKLTGKILAAKPVITASTATNLIAKNSSMDIPSSAATVNNTSTTLLYKINPAVEGVSLSGKTITVAPTVATGTTITIDVYASATNVGGSSDAEYSAPDTKKLTFKVVDKIQTNVSVSGKPDKISYGDSNFTLTATASNTDNNQNWKWSVTGTGISLVSSNTNVATFKVDSVTTSAVKVNVTYEDDKYTGSKELSLNVNKRTFTVTGATVEGKVYDGTTKATITGLTYGNLLDSDKDVVKVTGITATFASADANTSAVVNLDYTNAKASGTTLAYKNYELSTSTSIASVTSIISKAEQKLTVATNTIIKTYGDAKFKVVATGTSNSYGYSVSNPSVATISNIGEVTIKGQGSTNITVTALSNNNYNATSTNISLTVNQKDLSSGITIADIASAKYTGNAIEPDIIATHTSLGYKLVKDTDYTLEYASNTNVGTAKVTITGKGNYTGSVNKTFTINRADQTIALATNTVIKTYGDATFTNLGATANTSLSYASKNTQVITVNDGVFKILKAGEAVIDITAAEEGNYNKATATVLVKVNPKNISSVEVNSIEDKVYTKSAITPAIVATDTALKVKLASGTDYTLSYASNTNVGTAKAILTGQNNYTGTKEVTFNIIPADQTIAIATNTVIKTFGDSTFKVVATCTTASISYESSDSNVVSVASDTGLCTIHKDGTATITIKAVNKPNYNDASETVTITVNKKALNDTDFKFSYENEIQYTGQEIKPDVVATLTSISYKLVKDTDYEVSYASNTNVGTAKITLTAKNNSKFTGSVSKNFTITKADQTVNLASNTVLKTYGAATFTDLGASAKTNLTYVSSNTDVISVTSGNVLKINKVGESVITITAAANENYNMATATVLVKVSKAPLTVKASDTTITYGDAATNNGVIYTGFVYDDKASDLKGSLSYAYSYDTSVASKRKAGSYTITPSGLSSDNYSITFTTGTLTVAKKELTLASPTAIDVIDKIYNGDTTATLRAKETKVYNGIVFEDVLGLDITNVTGTFVDKYAGTDKSVTLSGTFAISGTNKDNYTLANPGTITLKGKILAQTPTITVTTDTVNVTKNGSVNLTESKYSSVNYSDVKLKYELTSAVAGVTLNNGVVSISGDVEANTEFTVKVYATTTDLNSDGKAEYSAPEAKYITMMAINQTDDSGSGSAYIPGGGGGAAGTTESGAVINVINSNISDKQAEQLVDIAKANNVSEIVVNAKGSSVISGKVTVTLPASLIEKTSENTKADIVVQTKLCEVTIPSASLDKLNNGSNIQIIATDLVNKIYETNNWNNVAGMARPEMLNTSYVGAVVDVTIKVDGKEMSSGFGNIEISIPIDSSFKNSGAIVLHVTKNSNTANGAYFKSTMVSNFIKGTDKITFNTNSLSYFIVLKDVNGFGKATKAKNCVATNQTIKLNGTEVNCEVYNVDGHNYFKLRDLAAMLKGLNSEFSISVNDKNQVVNISTSGLYPSKEAVEKATVDHSSSCVVSKWTLVVDNVSYDVMCYNIGGHNYFQLRPLGALLNFGVGYDSTSNTVTISAK